MFILNEVVNDILVIVVDYLNMKKRNCVDGVVELVVQLVGDNRVSQKLYSVIAFYYIFHVRVDYNGVQLVIGLIELFSEVDLVDIIGVVLKS